MPELPDVEGFRRIARKAAGRRIERVDLIDRTLLRGGRADAIEGERFGEPLRHGKWLVLPAGDADVLIHFGMTGRLDWARRRSARPRRERVTGPLGPDAVDVDRDAFRELLGRRRSTVVQARAEVGLGKGRVLGAAGSL